MNSCPTVSTCKYFKVCLSAGKAGRNAGRQTDRQLYRKAKNIPIFIKKDRETDRPADWLPSDKYMGRQAGQQAGRQKDRQTDIQTYRQTNRQTERQTLKYLSVLYCTFLLQ
jgi:hypothetical protein